MRKRFLSTLISLALSTLTACGGGGGGGSSVSWQPGIYTGTFTPSTGTPDAYALIITSDNRWGGANPDEGSTGTVSGATITALDFSATLSSTTGGSYTTSTSAGTFTLTDTGLYNRTGSLAKLSGTWVDNVYTTVTGTTTWVIDGAGAVSMSSTSGCAGTGTVSVISSNNEYEITLAVSSCGVFNGNYHGYGFTEDSSFTDDAFSFVVDNATAYAVFSPIKQ